MIIDPNTRTIGYYKDYTRDINIHIETVDGERAMTVTLFEAYPKTVGSIQMDASARDIIRLNVTWQYKYWTSYNTGVVTERRNPRPIYFRGENDPQGITASNGMNVLYDTPVVSETEIIAVENSVGL
jgi:hypothetical protein